MLSPIESAPASRAPRLAASIAPGPPPVMIAMPALAHQPRGLARELVLGVVRAACAPSRRTRRPRPRGASASKPCVELGLDALDPRGVGERGDDRRLLRGDDLLVERDRHARLGTGFLHGPEPSVEPTTYGARNAIVAHAGPLERGRQPPRERVVVGAQLARVGDHEAPPGRACAARCSARRSGRGPPRARPAAGGADRQPDRVRAGALEPRGRPPGAGRRRRPRAARALPASAPSSALRRIFWKPVVKARKLGSTENTVARPAPTRLVHDGRGAAELLGALARSRR